MLVIAYVFHLFLYAALPEIHRFSFAFEDSLQKSPNNSVKVFVRGEGGYYCHKIPYLLSLQSGVLIAMAEGRGKNGREACDDFSGTDLVFKRSFDNGLSWSDLEVLWSNSTSIETNIVGNAGIVQDRTTGRVWAPCCRNNEEVFITFSDDDGATWANPSPQPHLVLDQWKWVGLGPPAGLQLSSGRLLVPGYHTTWVKGDGLLSKGHTIYSDDHGLTWHIGSTEFGAPFLSNECQAVELSNGSVLINARTTSTQRIQVVSDDGGLTFGQGYRVNDLEQTLEGCEASIVREPVSNILYYSGAFSEKLIRRNMTVLYSIDDGMSWEVYESIDKGAVSYSALQLIQTEARLGFGSGLTLGLLYERSDSVNVIFEPDEIVYVPLKIQKRG